MKAQINQQPSTTLFVIRYAASIAVKMREKENFLMIEGKKNEKATDSNEKSRYQMKIFLSLRL